MEGRDTLSYVAPCNFQIDYFEITAEEYPFVHIIAAGNNDLHYRTHFIHFKLMNGIHMGWSSNSDSHIVCVNGAGNFFFKDKKKASEFADELIQMMMNIHIHSQQNFNRNVTVENPAPLSTSFGENPVPLSFSFGTTPVPFHLRKMKRKRPLRRIPNKNTNI